VRQHFTKRLDRVPGVDFRLPTEEELDALLAFQQSLGRQSDPVLPLPLKGTVPRRGQDIFLDNTLGKCNLCHVNAGANATLGAGNNLGNIRVDIGVEALLDSPAGLTGERVPPDGGFGTSPNPNPQLGFGDGSFNIPPLVEAADTPPFFHNNAIATLEGAVAFYNRMGSISPVGLGRLGRYPSRYHPGRGRGRVPQGHQRTSTVPSACSVPPRRTETRRARHASWHARRARSKMRSKSSRAPACIPMP